MYLHKEINKNLISDTIKKINQILQHYQIILIPHQ
jgi:hypothetical protein